MKKNVGMGIIPLMLVSLLSGCNGGTSTFKEEQLAALQKGFRFQTIVEEKVDGKEKSYRMDTAHDGNSFSYIQYADETGTQKQFHECYVKQENSDRLWATRLNVANEIQYYPVYNPASSEYYTWADGYDNVFTKLTYSDFIQTKDVYSLSEEKLEEVSPFIITQLYGNPGLVLDDFQLTMKKDVINLLVNASFVTGTKQYAYTFDAIVTDMGDDVAVDAVAVPFESVEDSAFEAMLTALKAHNWTATATNYYNDEVVSTSTFKSNADKLFYSLQDDTAGNIEAGFYVTEDQLIQEVTKKEENYYRVGDPMEGSLNEIWPSFRISRSCFSLLHTEEDSSINSQIQYQMKNVDGDFSVIYPLMVEADALADFVITIKDGCYIFENRYNNRKTTIIFDQIGSTDVGFTKDTVKDYTDTTTWAEVLDSDSYAFVISVISESDFTSLPVPVGYETATWYQFSEEPEYALLWAEGKATLTEDIAVYGDSLSALGFTFTAAGGENGGDLYTKDTLYVEILAYEDGFAIVLMNL